MKEGEKEREIERKGDRRELTKREEMNQWVP